MPFRMGDRIRNKRGREGVVEGESGERDVLIRYNDGQRVVWVQRQNIDHVASKPSIQTGQGVR